uniref:Ketoacyl_synth_N domain-containing protein n=1 Tax=Macrostomum lignano TaxID=282301 RepID=A0A1I8FQF0_9PLAT
GDVGEILVRSRGNASSLTAATAAAASVGENRLPGVIRQVDSDRLRRPPWLTGLSGSAAAALEAAPASDIIRLTWRPLWCAATQPLWTGAVFGMATPCLAVVMELSCRESDALDAVPQATTALLRESSAGGLRASSSATHWRAIPAMGG